MKDTKKTKILYWVFKALGVIVSCTLPIWAICERFPLWRGVHGAGRSIGAGLILIMIVVLIIFRKTVFSFVSEKLNLKHAPPIVVWLILLVVSYIMAYIADFMRDLTVVLWMGLLGCAVGTAFTYIAESRYRKKDETDA